MAYKFGQFRKEQYAYSNYVRQINTSDYTLGRISSQAQGFSGVYFNDIVIKRSFSTGDGSIFLRVALKRFSRDTKVTVKLTKSNASALDTTGVQTITHFTVPAGRTTEEMNTALVYDIIITPSDSYDQVVFAIDRDGQDITGISRAWIPASSFNIQSFGFISNIITTLDIDNQTKLKQVGIQGRPGLQICVNGEMIRVGRTGIYEINHGIDITFIGFIPEETDHFIMDYQY